MNLKRYFLIGLLALWAQSAHAITWLHLNTANDTAGGYYVVIWRENTNAWAPGSSAFASYTTTRDTFDIQASQNGTTGHYRVQVPAAIPAGYIQWSWFKEASVGARSHESDTEVAVGGPSYWNGYKFAEGPEIHSSISTVTSQTALIFDGAAGVAPQKDNSLVNYLARISDPTGGENSGYVSSVRRITAHTYDADNTEQEITLESAPDFTVAVGDVIELFRPDSSNGQSQLDDIETAVGQLSGGGPVNHAKVSANRILQVKSRGDGTFGVVGAVRMRPNETLWWAVNCAGSMLAPGDTLDAMAEPTVSGADAANADIVAYGILDTLAKFRVSIDASADEDDVINIEINLTPESGESLLITVPVTVLE